MYVLRLMHSHTHLQRKAHPASSPSLTKEILLKGLLLKNRNFHKCWPLSVLSKMLLSFKGRFHFFQPHSFKYKTLPIESMPKTQRIKDTEKVHI